MKKLITITIISIIMLVGCTTVATSPYPENVVIQPAPVKQQEQKNIVEKDLVSVPIATTQPVISKHQGTNTSNEKPVIIQNESSVVPVQNITTPIETTSLSTTNNAVMADLFEERFAKLATSIISSNKTNKQPPKSNSTSDYSNKSGVTREKMDEIKAWAEAELAKQRASNLITPELIVGKSSEQTNWNSSITDNFQTRTMEIMRKLDEAKTAMNANATTEKIINQEIVNAQEYQIQPTTTPDDSEHAVNIAIIVVICCIIGWLIFVATRKTDNKETNAKDYHYMPSETYEKYSKRILNTETPSVKTFSSVVNNQSTPIERKLTDTVRRSKNNSDSAPKSTTLLNKVVIFILLAWSIVIGILGYQDNGFDGFIMGTLACFFSMFISGAMYGMVTAGTYERFDINIPIAIYFPVTLAIQIYGYFKDGIMGIAYMPMLIFAFSMVMYYAVIIIILIVTWISSAIDNKKIHHSD